MTSFLAFEIGDSRKKRAAAAEAAAAAGEAAAAPRPPPDANEEGLVYDEFEALPLAQHAARPHRKFDTFDAALDEFFSKVRRQGLGTGSVPAGSRAQPPASSSWCS